MKTYEVWEMMRLTENFRRGGYFFFVELTDGKVTGYIQRREDNSHIWLGDVIDINSVAFQHYGNLPSDVEWVDQHRNHFRVLGTRTVICEHCKEPTDCGHLYRGLSQELICFCCYEYLMTALADS